tara:strand:+ start:393 stop:626 length:234 start_codon:yes stop_codon:yes gene_type:complete
MAYHIKKTSVLGSAVPTEGAEYYAGDNNWTNEYDKRKTYATESAANVDKQKTVTRTIGGKTYTYVPSWFKNSTVVKE